MNGPSLCLLLLGCLAVARHNLHTVHLHSVRVCAKDGLLKDKCPHIVAVTISVQMSLKGGLILDPIIERLGNRLKKKIASETHTHTGVRPFTYNIKLPQDFHAKRLGDCTAL